VIKVTRPTRGEVRVTFTLPAEQPAGPVSVVGDFNNWDPHAHPLRKRSNNTRSAVISVPPGSTLCFRYLGDGGMWFDDDTVGPVGEEGATITVPG
jgi:1,4-alpha-glucan branching enzyme